MTDTELMVWFGQRGLDCPHRRSDAVATMQWLERSEVGALVGGAAPKIRRLQRLQQMIGRMVSVRGDVRGFVESVAWSNGRRSLVFVTDRKSPVNLVVTDIVDQEIPDLDIVESCGSRPVTSAA